jgi:hypothetical protein
MSYEALQYWETALDIIGLLMCIATLVYIVRIRLVGRRGPVKPESGDFKEEMRVQADQQTADNALETIARALERERRNLQLYLGTGLQPASAGGAPNIGRSLTLPDRAAPVYQATENPRRKSGVYSEAMELAACGLSASQIADKVQIPKGEVELSLKLRNRRKKKG